MSSESFAWTCSSLGRRVWTSRSGLATPPLAFSFTLLAPVIGQIQRETTCLILCHIKVKRLQNEDALSNVLLFTDTKAKEQLINTGTEIKTPRLAHS